MNYKSARLLVDVANSGMDDVRKSIMAVSTSDAISDDHREYLRLALDVLNEVREYVGQLAEKAKRMAVEDVPSLSPGDYVATMKPLVAAYHRQLMVADRLAPCLSEDLQAIVCVLILVGDGKTVIRAAHDQSRPEAGIAVEAIVASIDDGTKRIISGPTEAEKQLAETTKLLRDCPHDRIEHRKCIHCELTSCMECCRLVPDHEGITEWVHCERQLVKDKMCDEPEMGDEDGWG